MLRTTTVAYVYLRTAVHALNNGETIVDCMWTITVLELLHRKYERSECDIVDRVRKPKRVNLTASQIVFDCSHPSARDKSCNVLAGVRVKNLVCACESTRAERQRVRSGSNVISTDRKLNARIIIISQITCADAIIDK